MTFMASVEKAFNKRLVPITVDWESYYGPSRHLDLNDKSCSLSSLSYQEYIAHPSFAPTLLTMKRAYNDTLILAPDDIEPMIRQLPWERILMIGQNLLFDAAVFYQLYGIRPAAYFDTISAARCLIRMENYDLDTLAVALQVPGKSKAEHKKALNKARGKYYEEMAGIPIVIDGKEVDLQEAFRTYGANDTDLTWAIAERLLPHMPIEELVEQDANLQQYTDPVLQINLKKLDRVEKAAIEKQKKLVKESGQTAKTLRSVDALAQVLRDHDVEPPVKLTEAKTLIDREGNCVGSREDAVEVNGAIQCSKCKQRFELDDCDTRIEMIEEIDDETGLTEEVPRSVIVAPVHEAISYAFSKDDVEFLKLQEHPTVGKIAKGRIAAQSNIVKTRTARIRNIYEAAGRVMPVAYNYHGAHTGRYSGTNKVNFANLMRVNKEDESTHMRLAVEAPPGHVLVVKDWSGIELRMNMYQAGQGDAIDMLSKGIDLYCDLATDIYGRVVSKSDKLERHVGKTAELGLGYGMGPPKFVHTLATSFIPVYVDLHEAQNIVYEVYRTKRHKVVSRWETLDYLIPEMARMDRRLVIPLYPGQEYKDLEYCELDRVEELHPHAPMLFGRGFIQLPNGRRLHYPNLRQVKRKGKKGQPDRLQWICGKFTNVYGGIVDENVIQGLSRDLLVPAKQRVSKRYPVVMHTYDELVCLAPKEEAEECEAFMEVEMVKVPHWCQGIPLDVEGGYAKEYSK